MSTTHTSRRAITALELIIVIGLLLILAAMLIPAVTKVRQAADRTHSINNLKQIGISVHAFHDANRDMPQIVSKRANLEGSAFFFLLPYVEQDNVYRNAMDKGGSWPIARTVIPVYVDPQDTSLPGSLYENAIATTSYAGNWQIMNGKYKLGNIPDGTSNTLMTATRFQLCNGTPNAWAYSAISTWTPMFSYYSTAKFQVNPKQQDCDPYVTQSIGSVLVTGLGDGSVRSVDAGLSPRTWHYVQDPADGNVLDADW